MKTHKVCTKCKINKSLEEFGKRSNVPDGRKSACKICKRKADRQFYHKNKEKEAERKRNSYLKNREKIIKKTSEYNIQRRKVDPLFKAKHNLRKRLRSVLLKTRWNKNNTFKEYIGCSLDELKYHLEIQFTEGMSWDNYGKWEIDHIVPLASAKNEELFKLCHHTNLQPLWMSDNRKKHAKQ